MPTEQTVLTVSAVHACVNIIAGAIASLPVPIYRINPADGERDEIHNDPLWWMLNEQFTPRWSASAAWEFITMSKLLHGDGFARIIRGPDAQPIGLDPIHPRRVTVAVTDDMMRLVYQVAPEFTMGQTGEQAKGAAQVYDQDDIIHVAGFGFNGFRGLSPLRYALRMTGAVALATQDYTGNFFANSARPDYAFTTEQKLPQDYIDRLRAMVDENHRTSARAHRPMVLHSGLDIKTLTMPLEEVQLLATRQFQVEEICRIYGVPPFMVGSTDKTTSWGTGVEAMGTGFVRYTLRQHLTAFENELNRKLFRTAARRLEFDTTMLTRANMQELFNAVRVAVGRAGEPGWMAKEEARHITGLKRKSDFELFDGGTKPTPDATQKAMP